MEWFLMRVYFAALSNMPPYTDPFSTTPPSERFAASPTDLDLHLIRLAYEVAAPELRCAKCCSRLGRGLQLATKDVRGSSTWHVLVSTRCRGWRRHRHTAIATEESNSLRLGRLRLPR
jgi:hypothetical protein